VSDKCVETLDPDRHPAGANSVNLLDRAEVFAVGNVGTVRGAVRVANHLVRRESILLGGHEPSRFER
jgi:hypothetical protein